MKPVVRVSILRCPPERFTELRQMAVDADLVLRSGMELNRIDDWEVSSARPLRVASE
jgi:hypothetical protein